MLHHRKSLLTKCNTALNRCIAVPASFFDVEELGAAVEGSLERRKGSLPVFKALLLDVTGTMIEPSESVATVYRRYGIKYGLSPDLPSHELTHRFRAAYNVPPETGQRFVGDARAYWASVLRLTTGVADPRFHEEIYQYYAGRGAWRVLPHARETLAALRGAGVRMAAVSNFDTRLRGLLQELGLAPYLDAIITSGEVGIEKPSPALFYEAMDALGGGIRPDQVLMLGDDRRNDLWGARAAGVDCWLWGSDLPKDFGLLRALLLREGGLGPGGAGQGKQ